MVPKWNDDEALVAWIGDLFDEKERDFYLHYQPTAGVPASTVFEAMESEAIKAAEGGNFRPLAELNSPKNNPLTKQLRDWGFHLSQRAEELISDFLLYGRKGRRGRPKQTIAERHAATPLHEVAKEVDKIEEILRWNYKGQKAYHDRAITIAGLLNGIEHDTLANYLRSERQLP